MKLEAFAVTDTPQPLIAAPATRDWMDERRHAYRCLPLAIANTYGWQLLLPVDVDAEWNGGLERADLSVHCERENQAISHFMFGILTFDVGYVFRTPPGFHLLVTGPSNTFKDGVAPMMAVIESDWLPYTFTFNYRFTRPGRVRWQAGEPYAQICVIPAGVQESVEPVIRSLRDNAQLQQDYELWQERRGNLSARQAQGDSASWIGDRDYFCGRFADGRPIECTHTTKLRLRSPVDERGKEPSAAS